MENTVDRNDFRRGLTDERVEVGCWLVEDGFMEIIFNLWCVCTKKICENYRERGKICSEQVASDAEHCR